MNQAMSNVSAMGWHRLYALSNYFYATLVQWGIIRIHLPHHSMTSSEYHDEYSCLSYWLERVLVLDFLSQYLDSQHLICSPL